MIKSLYFMFFVFACLLGGTCTAVRLFNKV